MKDECEYVPFSVRMQALAGKADSADLNAWMQRRFDAAWLAFNEAQLGRLSTISCGGEQADEAYRECLSAALAAWEAFDGILRASAPQDTKEGG